LEHFLFFHILGIIIPTDEFIFFRGAGIPPTSHRKFLWPLKSEIATAHAVAFGWGEKKQGEWWASQLKSKLISRELSISA
jgi:hypothetical protein